jgi:hypothetical protein
MDARRVALKLIRGGVVSCDSEDKYSLVDICQLNGLYHADPDHERNPHLMKVHFCR